MPAAQASRSTPTARATSRAAGRSSSATNWWRCCPSPPPTTYTLYYTSAAPTPIGLDPYTVTAAGVQTLTVSSANPLLLFNLDVSLEWDARSDQQFLSQLQYDLQRTSEFLYDWSNGQAALGQVTIYQDREQWNDAHIRIYATNRLRPNAAQGGIVSTVITDPLKSAHRLRARPGAHGRGLEPLRRSHRHAGRGLAAHPGPRAGPLRLLPAGHLPRAGRPTAKTRPGRQCPGAMSDPYRDDYSEFFNHETYPAAWNTVCSTTLAAQETGRWDWATIKTFYPDLNATTVNPGPSTLPLAVTQISVITPTATATDLIDVPIFNLAGRQPAAATCRGRTPAPSCSAAAGPPTWAGRPWTR